MSEEECKLKAVLWIPKGKYEIKSVTAGVNLCYVDFKPRGFSADVDCDMFCDGAMQFSEEEDDEKREQLYDGCMDECGDSKRTAEVGSVTFDPSNGTVREATLPVSCEYVWGTEEMEEEELAKKQEEVVGAFQGIGCDKFDTSHIHPHEVARGAWESVTDVEAEREMEYPAACYVHPSSGRAGKCRLKDVLKVVEEWV